MPSSVSFLDVLKNSQCRSFISLVGFTSKECVCVCKCGQPLVSFLESVLLVFMEGSYLSVLVLCATILLKMFINSKILLLLLQSLGFLNTDSHHTQKGSSDFFFSYYPILPFFSYCSKSSSTILNRRDWIPLPYS